MQTDPYTILGVARTASRDDVRRAYRRRSKSAHPDAGGSQTEFALVKLAHDTLADAARRAKYDETGRIEDVAVDNHLSQVVHFVGMAFNLVMGECEKRGRAPTEIEFVDSIADALGILKDQVRETIAKMDAGIAKLGKLDGRFGVKRGAKLNLLGNMVSARRVEIENGRRLEADKIKLIDEAIKLVRTHTFRADVVQPVYQTTFVRWGS